jgi:hypothetical protein
MAAIEQIRQRLSQYPQVRYTTDAGGITIHAPQPDGFDVSLVTSPRGYTIVFDGWHETFTSETEALHCVAFGLSTACRLRVEYRGATAYRWTVEALEGGQWRPDSTTGLLFAPWWRRHRVAYRQNRLIPAGPGV